MSPESHEGAWWNCPCTRGPLNGGLPMRLVVPFAVSVILLAACSGENLGSSQSATINCGGDYGGACADGGSWGGGGGGGDTAGGGGNYAGGGGADTGGCTFTQGYWKNHPSAWPVTSLTIGGVSYTEAQLLTIFGDAPGGDASLILAHQLIAALLNVDNGAVPSATVQQAINDAQAWMAANKGSS